MTLQKLQKLGICTAFAVSVAMPLAANSNDAAAQKVRLPAVETCSPLFQTSTGREVNAGLSAHVYSQENIGAVGISIFPGQDLGSYSPHEIGVMLVKVMAQNGVEAQCFVHNEYGPNGTAVNFKIDGLSWKPDGSLNVSQSLDRETLIGVIAEAKTAGMLLATKADYSPSN